MKIADAITRTLLGILLLPVRAVFQPGAATPFRARDLWEPHAPEASDQRIPGR